MVRLFSHFVDWCAARGLKPDDYTIVIVPDSPRAEAHFKAAWNDEFAHLNWNRERVGSIYDGMMCGVPFKIEMYEKDLL